MKKQHTKLIEEKLPDILPMLEQVLRDNGFEEFSIKQLRLVHGVDKCNGCPDGKTCRQVFGPSGYEWKCLPED